MRSELAAMMSFAQWLDKNPAPDLQELVREHGGYGAIPGEAWAKFEADYHAWQTRYRSREWDR